MTAVCYTSHDLVHMVLFYRETRFEFVGRKIKNKEGKKEGEKELKIHI